MCGRCIIEHNVNQVNEGEKYEGYARLMATIWLVLWEAREWKDVKFDLIGKHKSVSGNQPWMKAEKQRIQGIGWACWHSG